MQAAPQLSEVTTLREVCDVASDLMHVCRSAPVNRWPKMLRRERHELLDKIVYLRIGGTSIIRLIRLENGGLPKVHSRLSSADSADRLAILSPTAPLPVVESTKLTVRMFFRKRIPEFAESQGQFAS